MAGTSPDDPHFSVPGTMLNLLRLSQQSLRELANQTGGFEGIDSNDLSGVFDRIVQENSAYYLMRYYSTNDRRDGRFRRIDVCVRRPGRYQLRVAAVETGSGSTGSVFHDIDVPDFRSAGFWMSGIALTSGDASETPTVRAIDSLSSVLVSPATTARAFGRDNVIALLAEFYDNGSVTPHRVELSAFARSEDGRMVFEHRDERSSAGLNSRYRYAVQIPLNTFAPGNYTIRLEGRTEAGGGVTAARDVRIQVR